MKTQSALRSLIVTALGVALRLRLLAVRRRARSGAPSAMREKRRAGRAGAARARAHASLRDRRRPPTSSASCRRRSATKEDTLTDIARRFNVGYEEIVRANPGVDPWLPGEGKRDRHPVAVHPAERAARRHRHQRRRDAALLLPEGEEGRAAGRAHLSHRHRQGGLEDARRRDEDRAPAEGSHLAPDAVDHQGTSRRARREARARSSARARTIRSAASRSTSAGRAT